ncbi:RpiR family transcriptional regulator, partial [Streptomyces sp. CBMA156]|nr:RpiR family transcriptional regulator [Streptomyces sp. CBMA156]
YPAFLGATGLAIGLAGAGRYSLDHLTGHVLDRPWVGLAAFVASAAGAYGVVARRRHAVRLREERAAVETDAQEGSGLS